jgi:hypothetical protein
MRSRFGEPKLTLVHRLEVDDLPRGPYADIPWFPFRTLGDDLWQSYCLRDRTIECYGCYQRFKTVPHMILHLENGGCVSEITTKDLYTTATQCYQSHKYIDRDYEPTYSMVRILKRYIQILFFHSCVHSAIAPFRSFRAYFSITCNQTLQMGAIGKLLKWLDNQYR